MAMSTALRDHCLAPDRVDAPLVVQLARSPEHSQKDRDQDGEHGRPRAGLRMVIFIGAAYTEMNHV